MSSANRIFAQIDLETLGRKNNAPIVSLGACAYSHDLGIFSTLHLFFDLDEQFKAGRNMDQQTLLWWLTQSEPARAALANSETRRYPVLDVRRQFIKWWNSIVHRIAVSTVDVYPMGNGSEFDISMLRSLFEDVVPWNYKHVIDFRTITTFYRDEVVWPEKTVKHNALEDAKAQAQVHLNLMRNHERLR